jgi:hypothetical protein
MKVCVGITIFFGVVFYLLVILFGPKFAATASQVKETEFAQKKLSSAIFSTLQDVPKIEVAIDYSVRAYIHKRNYMAVPYPYRAEAITSIGKAWCDNPGAFRLLLPKVVLRDFQTGEVLAAYRCCIWGNASIEPKLTSYFE